jgi:hypothetical protein
LKAPKPLPASLLLEAGPVLDDSVLEPVLKLARDTLDELSRLEQQRVLEQDRRRQVETARIRQIAPGLNDELHPTLVGASTNNTSTGIGSVPTSAKGIISPPVTGSKFDYLEFEQGLPPKNPWDIEDDMSQLQDVLGKATVTQPVEASFNTAALPPRPVHSSSESSIRPPLMPRPKLGSLSAQLSTPLTNIPPSNQRRDIPEPAASIPSRLPPSLHSFYGYAVSMGHHPSAILLGYDLFDTDEKKIYAMCSERSRLFSFGYAYDVIDSAFRSLIPLGVNVGDLTIQKFLEADKALMELGFERAQVTQALLKTRLGSGKGDEDHWTERAADLLSQ